VNRVANIILQIFSVIPGLANQHVSTIPAAIPSTPQSPAAPLNGLSILQATPAAVSTGSGAATDTILHSSTFPVAGESQFNFIPAVATDHASAHTSRMYGNNYC